jgi:hypothetical protein
MEGCVPDLSSRAVIAGVAVLAVAVIAAFVLVVVLEVRPFEPGRTEFAQAVASAPAGAERLSWTDWAGVRRELGSAVDARASESAVREFLEAGFDADLTSRSALVQSAPALQTSFGFSPASAEWELFSQSREGAVVTLRMPDHTDFGEIEDRLRAVGFSEPDRDTGVWRGGPDLLSSRGVEVTPELAYVALDSDRRLVRASDDEAYLQAAGSASPGDGDGVDAMHAVTDALGEPLSAAVYSGDHACGALAMAQADAEDQSQAADLVAAAGTVDPYLAFAMGVRPGGDVRVAMAFETDAQARANADSRSALATGPAVGQGGDFADRFTLRLARADGPVVTLDLRPAEGQYVLGDLSSGPVLFATC